MTNNTLDNKDNNKQNIFNIKKRILVLMKFFLKKFNHCLMNLKNFKKVR